MKFLRNSRIVVPKFKAFYSTSLFPSSLKDLFSKLPRTLTQPVPVEEGVRVQNEKPVKTKKARTLAGFINTKPWSTRLEIYLSSFNPLSQTTFFQTLRLIKTPSNALRFFRWAQNSGFPHNHHSYFMMLEILGRARNLNPARSFLLSIPKKSNHTVPLSDKFFNSLIRSYGDAGLFQESIKVFKVMKSMGISPSVVTFNSLFVILFKRGRMGMVFDLYDEMLKTYGVKPDLYTFNVLIRGFCTNSRVDLAFRMFKDMEKFDCEPDIVTYNTIVDGLCKSGKVNIARNVITGMRKKPENLRPNVVTYTALIRGYCGKQEIEEALGLFKEMIDSGIKPNNITFNTIIKGLCESQRLDAIKEIMNECRGEGEVFVPDTCTFNTMMNTHCDKENLDDAWNIFEKMKELNVKRDSATYSMLIRGLCKKGDLDKAERLLDELFERNILMLDDNSTPLTAAYNPIFQYLCINGKTKKAERVFRQLMKRGISDPVAFETLILGHCKEETFESGHKLLVLMLRRDFMPDIKIYDSLIAGMLRKGEAMLAYDTLQRMLKSSYLPRTSTFHHILMELIEKGRAHDSANLMTLMMEKEIRPNISLSTDVVWLLFKSGLRDKAFQLVKRLYGNNYIVNMEKLISLLCEGKKLLEASELLVFSLGNAQRVDSSQCDAVLTGLCSSRRLSEAFRLYYELLENGFRQPWGCLAELRNGLEAEGKSKEAEFVAKRMMDS